MGNSVLLRPFCLADAPSFYRNVISDPSLRRFLEVSDAPTLAEAEQYIQNRIRYQERPRFYDYAIVLEESGEVIGEANAAYIREGLADIGYVIGAGMRKQGYGTQAVCLLLERLRQENIHTAYAAVHSANSASRRLLEHVGMKQTAEVPPGVKRVEEDAELCWYVKQLSV